LCDSRRVSLDGSLDEVWRRVVDVIVALVTTKDGVGGGARAGDTGRRA
jgi:hypothetical protein